MTFLKQISTFLLSLGLSSLLLAEASQAAAQQPSFFESMIPLLIMFIAFYFILIRPQAKKAKKHEKMLKELKPGDEVVTTGGIFGRVKSLSDDFITVDVGSTQLKVLKANVSRFSKTSPQAASVKSLKESKRA